MAHMVATWSKDPSTQVGALIVSPDRSKNFWGYNGFPRGIEDDPALLNDREDKYPRMVHAELNALLMADTSVQGWTLYSTLIPCAECAGPIIQKGITRVVTPTFGGIVGKHASWTVSFNITRDMFRQAHVSLEEMTHEV